MVDGSPVRELTFVIPVNTADSACSRLTRLFYEGMFLTARVNTSTMVAVVEYEGAEELITRVDAIRARR